MATSGSWNLSRTSANLIQAAFENLGVIIPGGTVAAADSTLALSRLNHIAKQIAGDADGFPGVHIIHRQRVTLFLAKGQQTYLIGPGSSDARAAVTYGRTTISANEAALQTTLSVTSNTDTTTFPGSTVTMTASDIVGIELNDGTIHWSTISGTPGATMDIAAGIASAANAGNYVYWFTARAQRFLLAEAAVLRDSNRTETPLYVYSEVAQYAEGVSDKYADGDPTSILIEPLLTQTRVTLNSQPTDVTKQIVLTVQYPAEDYDATTDDIAFPQEFYRFFEWELAFAISPAYGSVWTPVMEQNRKEAKAIAMRQNPENSSACFVPGGY